MTRPARAVLAALALFAAPALSFAQSFPITLPAQTVYGRLGTVPGPGQAIPFANFATTISGLLASNFQNTIVAVSGLACDGVTDDSATLQAALNALTAPATVALPRGTCVLHGITIPTGVSIKGTSTDGTVVAPNANGQTVFSKIYTVSTLATFGVSELTIDCKAFTGATAISVTLAKETQWRNLDIAGCATAVALDRGFDHKLSNVSVRGNASQGAGQIKMWSSSDSDHIFNVSLVNVTTLNIGNGVQADTPYFRRAVNSYVTNYGANDLSTGGTPRNGLVIENDSQGVYVSQFIVAGAATGILMQTGAGTPVAPSFNVISNFGIDQSSTAAISVSSGTYTTFSNGVVAASGVATTISAITVSGGSFNTIQGTTVSGYSGATGTAVNFSAGVADWSLVGNRFDNNHTCINIAGTNTDFRVMNNTCTNVTTPVAGAAAGGGNLFNGNLGIGFQANTPNVYQDATNGLVNVGGGGATYDWQLLGRGGNQIAALVSGTNDLRLVADTAAAANQGHIRTGLFPPSLGATCGTSPAIVGSDTAGEVTTGTGNPTSCVLTFAVAYINKPFCTFQQEDTPLAAWKATWDNLAITVTQTAASGNKFTYHCTARSGG